EIAPAEHDRLFAHLLWLSTAKVTLSGLKARIDALSDVERESFGDALITIAAAEGAVSPAAMTAITKAFRTLGLDSDTVSSRLHTALTGGASSATPSTNANGALDTSTIDR